MAEENTNSKKKEENFDVDSEENEALKGALEESDIKDDKVNESSVQREDESNADEAHAKDTDSENAKSEEERQKEVEDAVKSALKDKKPTKEEQQISELTDKVKRQMAEFENFRKRSEKEKAEMFDAGAANIIGKILPIVDNFERGLASAKEGDAFSEGMEKVYKQFTSTLTEIGVTPIDAKGKTFDPNFHNAVMHVDDDQYGESEVIEELQKGYMYHDKVVRHSMVKVAN